MKTNVVSVQQPQPRYRVIVAGRVIIGTEEEIRQHLTEMRES